MGQLDEGPSVVVVGAGIAGLTAAWLLQRAGIRVRVIEREKQPGGRMRTIHNDGFRIELGATILGMNYTRMRELIGELGISESFGPASSLVGFAHADGIHHWRAKNKLDLLRTRLVGTQTKMALVRALPRIIAERRSLDWGAMHDNVVFDEISAADYVRRNLTQEAMDRVCEPLFGGGMVFASPEEINAADMLFYAKKMLVPHFNSPQGTGTLTRALSGRLLVELGSEVTSVVKANDEVLVTWRREGEVERCDRADAVIVALPAKQVPAILPGMAAGEAAYLRELPYSRTLVIHFGLDKIPPGEKSALLFMAKSHHPELIGVELMHNQMRGRVDGNRGLLTVYVRRPFTDRHWHSDDAEITHDALAAVCRVLPGVDNDVVSTYVNRLDLAIVVRPPGGYRALRAFEAQRAAGDRSIQLAGDYYGPSNAYGALLSGEKAAARTFGYLFDTQPSPMLTVTN